MWYDPLIGFILFGIVTIAMGYASGYILKMFETTKIPAECADWNKHHIMEQSLFITGGMVWLLSYVVLKLWH